jgi:LuxR family maltose regulon positive regulatory protein
MFLGPHRLPIIGFANIRKSILLYEWNQLELAWDMVNQGLEMIEQWGEKDSYIAGLIQSAQISQALGDIHQAFRKIKTAKQISKDFNYWFDRVEAVEALLHAKNGGVDHATTFLQKHQQLLNLAPMFTQEYIYRYLVEILLILGEIGEASNIIKKLIPVVEKSDSTDTLIRTLLLQSRVLHEFGDEEKAIQIISNALELAAPGGYARVFIDGGDSIAHLLYACAQRSLHSTYIAKLLDEFTKYTQLQPLKNASGTDPLVEPISPREIDVLARIADGCSNQEIAQALHLSLYTIKSHARNIYGKLGVKNRTEAVAKARFWGLLPKD